MNYKQYETVFIITPVLSEEQMRDTVEKFRKVLTDNGAEIIHEENWGLKKLTYSIQHKSSGFYHLLEYKAPVSIVNTLHTEFSRDERIMRYLTTNLDKYAVEYNEKRRKGLIGKNKNNQNVEKEG
ncbi:MAG: 30S ribosomal protein S6 [Thermonemataceae bacterium]|nr:30S ribosomal protein S6 [Thermonemataceae bacterium]